MVRGIEEEGRVQGNSKMLTLAAWDNVIDTPGKDWKEICLGSNTMPSRRPESGLRGGHIYMEK